MLNRDDQSRLLDYHLRQLGEEEAQSIVRRIEDDPDFRAESRGIQRTLQLLNALDVAIPSDLQQRIRAGLDQRLRPIRIEPEIARTGLAGSLLSLRDLVAAAAMIAVAVGLFIPAFSRAREQGHRAMCESQLRSVGYGMNAYAASFGGQLPFAGSSRPGASWLPVNQPGVPVQDNRRHAYLLIRQKMARPSDFVCPSRSDGVVMEADQPEAFETFPECCNSTYSLQCMAGVRPRISQYPDMPLMADQNPLFAGGLFMRPQRRDFNSPNHAHDGQNVLLMDGRVVWSKGPQAGIGRDNIWLIQGREEHQYRGMEVPTVDTDAFLVP